MKKKYLIMLMTSLSLFWSPAYAENNAPPSLQAAKLITDSTLTNFYQVSPSVFRSSQPNTENMRELEQRGFGSVLNLRNYHTDKDEAKNTQLALYHVPMNAGSIGDKQIIDALTVLKDAPKPIVIHCWHGSDRTGAVIAMYRMVFEHWPREDAIAEMMKPEFGHHEFFYPNIQKYLQSVDIEAIRQQVLITPPNIVAAP